jgi:hypothetical protein
MYLESKMTIDPAQLTEIHRIKPTKGFARIANLLPTYCQLIDSWNCQVTGRA